MSNRTVTQLGAIVLMASSIVPLSAKTQTVKGNTIRGHGRGRCPDSHVDRCRTS